MIFIMIVFAKYEFTLVIVFTKGKRRTKTKKRIVSICNNLMSNKFSNVT